MTMTLPPVPMFVAEPADVTVESGQPAGCEIPPPRSAVVRPGAAWCWGDNSSGQLGDGSNMQSPVPVVVVGGVEFALP